MKRLSGIVALLVVGADGPFQPAQGVVLLPPATARSWVFGAISGIVPMSGGRILVNDTRNHRVVLLRPDLSVERVVLGSTPAGPTQYGGSDGALLRYGPDSALFVDPVRSAALVLSANGGIVGTVLLPRSVGPHLIGAPGNGHPGVSALFGVVFRTPLLHGRHPGVPDTDAIVAVRLTTGRIDTLARLVTPRIGTTRLLGSAPAHIERRAPAAAWVDAFDAWALLADGTVVIVRGGRSEAEWIGPGSVHTTAALPGHRPRLTDADKRRLVDSLNRGQRRSDSLVLDRWLRDSVGRAKSGRPNGSRRPAPYAALASTDIPDYLPAVIVDGDCMRGDADGNLWLRARHDGTAPCVGTAYDVLSRTGALVRRVRIPDGRTIAGFGPNGTVYLGAREAGGFRLERTVFNMVR